jgi:hypothetical protein
MKLPRISIRSGAAATLSVLLAASAIAAMAPSQALTSAGVGPRDSTRAGFPAYYTDNAGVALQLCIDGSAKCGLATLKSDGAGGDGVGVGPDGEGFYFLATTTVSGATFDIDIEVAAEAAWLSRSQPMTFDRLRIRGHTTTTDPITVETPYGTTTLTPDDPINARNVNFTEDVGCVIAPCNFKEMTTLPERHITSWITANAAPAGYLGNAVTEQPANVDGAAATATVTQGVASASTDRWVIQGKKAAANRVSLPATLNFGNAARLTTKSVTMKNLGSDKAVSRTISAVTMKGSKNFTVVAKGSTCKAGTALAVGDSCKVVVRFKPVRASTATLTITDNVGANTVKLRGR